MLKEHFDIIVLGSGPAGEAAAMNAKKNGRTVAVVCDLEYVGGSCTHLGTIPFKVATPLRKASHAIQFQSDV